MFGSWADWFDRTRNWDRSTNDRLSEEENSHESLPSFLIALSGDSTAVNTWFSCCIWSSISNTSSVESLSSLLRKSFHDQTNNLKATKELESTRTQQGPTFWLWWHRCQDVVARLNPLSTHHFSFFEFRRPCLWPAPTTSLRLHPVTYLLLVMIYWFG